jgi:murein DD-endopeptidase MepM/ murein hydrolase activator NlpD
MKILLFLILCILSSTYLFAEEKSSTINGVLKDGELKLIKFDLPKDIDLAATEVKAKVFNLKFPFFEYKNNTYCIIAAPLGVASGEYSLTVSDSKEKISEFKIGVQGRQDIKTEEVLNTTEVSVLPKQGEVIDRVTREDAELKNVFKVISPIKYWDNKFIEPVRAHKNSPFGIYRVYSNHLRRRTHWGIDYRVGVGTSVKASAEGVVVLARDLYFPGKTIIIDHGLGLYTGYSHLRSMKVKVGDRVKISQIIGKSGRSGKVSGAHLHWMAINGRVKVDPLALLKINLK